MRFHTLGWFYDSKDMLTHVRHLQFDPNMPYRTEGVNFGGTDLTSFHYHLYQKNHTIYQDFFDTKIPVEIERVHGNVSLSMQINPHTTQLWDYLTRLEPMSKILVRICKIDEFGRLLPYLDYTFKECWLFNHKTWSEGEEPAQYQIDFTYCCAEIHCYDGNRFASHERCKAREPNPADSRFARERDTLAQQNAVRQQKAVEESRLEIKSSFDLDSRPLIHRFEVTANSEFRGLPMMPGGLDEVAFHIVEENQSTDSLIDFLFHEPTEATRTHFKNVNKHLQGGVTAGQMVFLTPQESKFYQTHANFLAKEAFKVDSTLALHKENREVFAKTYTKIGNYAGLGGNLGSYTTVFFQQQTKQIAQSFNEIGDAFSSKFRTTGGHLNEADFFAERSTKELQLKVLLQKQTMADKLGVNDFPLLKDKLKLKRYSFEQTWRNFGTKYIPTFSEHYSNVANLNKLLRTGGWIATGFSAFSTHTKIAEACLLGNAQTCEEVRLTEWSAFGGNVGGSAVGASVGVAAANAAIYCSGLVLGISTAGIGSAIGVGVIAIAGTYIGGKMAEEWTRTAFPPIYHDLKENGPPEPFPQLKGYPILLITPS